MQVGAAGKPASVPLRIDAPVGTPAALPPSATPGTPFAIPVTGGIPFPRGALANADRVRVLAGKEEVPAQVTRTAVWPDGSVKWVLVDLVIPTGTGSLRLEYGPGVSRAKVPDPLEVETTRTRVKVRGPGLRAEIFSKDGSLSELAVDGRRIFTKKQAARLYLNALRVAGPDSFPGPSRVCFDRKAKVGRGEVVVEETSVEAAGPIRARILLRGHFRVPGWGTGLPGRVLALEPPERVPFSLRLTFVRGVPVVIGDHQLVYTGEPDRDLVTSWGFDLPGQGWKRRLVLEDLDYGGNIGLFALRFLLAEDHRVPPGPWKERLADTGVEPRELLLSMQWRDGLKTFCGRIGVRYDADRPDDTVRRAIEKYRRR